MSSLQPAQVTANRLDLSSPRAARFRHVKLFASVVGLFLGAAMASAQSGARLMVTVSNPLTSIARPSETVSVPWSEIERAMPGALLQHLAVHDSQGHNLAYQVTNINPLAKDTQNVGLGYGDLLFQHDFAKGEASAVFTIEKIAQVAPVFPTKTYARYIPERLDDFAWENDKIGHRAYGQALANRALAGTEYLISSGLDVWCKRVTYPIVDRWYNKGHNHYHIDEGEGMDMYNTGSTRGCGGTGIWDGHSLAVSRNYTTWKILANGPIRTIFELSYAPWEAHGVRVTEVKRFTVDAGHNLDRIDSTFEVVSGSTPTLDVAIGLNKNSADKGQDPVTTLTKLPADGALAQWCVQKTNGSLGTAVIVPGPEFTGFASDAHNDLVLTRVTPGRAITYYAGAGWSMAGEFTTEKAWNTYVSECTARIRAPLSVSYSAEQ